jgi:hypothetical protein
VSVDDVVAGIDIDRVAGHQASRIVREERRRNTDIVDRHEAPRRRLAAGLAQQVVEGWDPRGRAGREGPGRDRVNANALRAELGRALSREPERAHEVTR